VAAPTLLAVFVRMACPISALRIGAMAAASVRAAGDRRPILVWAARGPRVRRRYRQASATTTAASNRTPRRRRRSASCPRAAARAQGRRGISAPIAQRSLGHPRGDAAHKPAVEGIPLRAIKPISREWRVSPNSGPSRGGPRRRASRPIEASKDAVCYVRLTSTPAVSFAQTAVIAQGRAE
jgi:hypothetical protein